MVSTTSTADLPVPVVDVDRNAAAVVDDRAAVVGVENHVDVRAVPGQRLVDGVVDDLEHEVVEAVAAVSPMYIAGRLRTASSPSRTLMSLAVYVSAGAVPAGGPVFGPLMRPPGSGRG